MRIRLAEGSIVLRADDFERGYVVAMGPADNMKDTEAMVVWEGGKQAVSNLADLIPTMAAKFEVIGDPTKVYR